MMAETTTHRQVPDGFALFGLGFRPFYLAAAGFAVLALPIWLLIFLGASSVNGYLVGVDWHSHEMVFGFASAVIAGFLLTAVRNWTGLPTPTGRGLAAMFFLWLAARVLAFSGLGHFAAAADIAFFPVLGVVVGMRIIRSRNARNVKLLVLLGGLTIVNGTFHAAKLGMIPFEWSQTSITAALDLLTVLMAIIGGRVIPVFTANAVPGASPQQSAAVDFVAFAALIAVLAAGLLGSWYRVPDAVWLTLLVAAALAHLVRWLLWQPQRTLRNPLLLMLPAAYLWIPISLALRALGIAGLAATAAAIHALTLGAISALMIAMMMRSSLGHTGRPLEASKADSIAFALVQIAAVVRVLGTVAVPAVYQGAVIASGVLWSLAFAIFLLRYGPMLTRPRVDGRPG